MQQTQEAAAEAEAQRRRALGLEMEAGVVEPQLAEASRRSSKSAASTGNRPQKTTGCTALKPGSAWRPAAFLGDGVADWLSATALIAAVMKPISPGPSSPSCSMLRP